MSLAIEDHVLSSHEHARLREFNEPRFIFPVCTDALMSYDDLGRDYDRQIIDHLEAYAKGNVHSNSLENFSSLFKRALKGTYVSVEPFQCDGHILVPCI